MYSFSAMQGDFPALPPTGRSHHIFLPYFGGVDDNRALMLALQVCEKSEVTATIVRISIRATDTSEKSPEDDHFEFVSSRVSADVAPRVKFETMPGTSTAKEVLELAAKDIGANTRDPDRSNLIVLGRRSGAELAGAKDLHSAAEEVNECLGVVAGYFIADGVQADILVVQAKAPKSSA